MKLVKVNKNKADHINMYIIPCVATTCAHSLNNRVLKVLLSQAKKTSIHTSMWTEVSYRKPITDSVMAIISGRSASCCRDPPRVTLQPRQHGLVTQFAQMRTPTVQLYSGTTGTQIHDIAVQRYSGGTAVHQNFGTTGTELWNSRPYQRFRTNGFNSFSSR